MTRKRKARKPRKITVSEITFCAGSISRVCNAQLSFLKRERCGMYRATRFDVRDAKRLHKFTGAYIAWAEREKP